MSTIVFKPLLTSLAILSLSGCATSGFKAPVWKLGDNNTNPTTVDGYLALHISKYDQMVGQLETGKLVLELPVVGAAIVGPAGVALGEGTKFAIKAATVAASGAAFSSYFQPRQRLSYVLQARTAAVCVKSEYVQQTETAVAGGFLQRDDKGLIARTSTISDLGPVQSQVSGSGRIAVMAADEIVTKIKARLGGLGEAPNYSAIVQDIRAKYETAGGQATKAVTAKTLLDPEATKFLAEYSGRIAECVAKVQ